MARQGNAKRAKQQQTTKQELPCTTIIIIITSSSGKTSLPSLSRPLGEREGGTTKQRLVHAQREMNGWVGKEFGPPLRPIVSLDPQDGRRHKKKVWPIISTEVTGSFLFFFFLFYVLVKQITLGNARLCSGFCEVYDVSLEECGGKELRRRRFS